MVAFQPHRYSRTRALLPEFFPVFAAAHLVMVTEIYAAGEEMIPGLSGELIARGIRDRGHPAVYFAADGPAQAEVLLQHLQEGDLLLTLGAGDIWKLGEAVLAELSRRAVTSDPSSSAGGMPWRAQTV